MNSLAETNKEFHWSRAYSWYSYLHVEDALTKCLRSSGLVKFWCMPEFFGIPELVLQFARCFDATRRIVQVGDTTIYPISLNPKSVLDNVEVTTSQ